MNQRPGGRRGWVVVAAMLTAVVGGGVAAKQLLTSGAAVSATSRAETDVITKINKQRAARGLKPLKPDPKLTGIARSWSVKMLSTGSFSHGDFSHRLYAAVGRRQLIAEDIGYTSPGVGPIVQLWMDSPPHRRNILLKGAKRVGVGIVIGTYQGQAHTALVTADFSS